MHVDLGVVTPKRSLGLQWEIKKFLDQLLTPTARGGGYFRNFWVGMCRWNP